MSGLLRKENLELPNVTLPRLSSLPRNPKGWNTSEMTIRSEGWSGALDLRQREPAGDPPASWMGTRPEWAVNWALKRTGLEEGSDFIFEAMLPGVGTSYYSTVDFLIYGADIGIEVQGTFWHYGLGTDKEFHDFMRVSLFAEQGVKIIFIDEEDCLADPEYYVKQALQGIDHSDLLGGQ